VKKKSFKFQEHVKKNMVCSHFALVEYLHIKKYSHFALVEFL
jgi:hypothetical protein